MTATKTWRDAVTALEAARERAGELFGRPLIEDLIDPATGEIRGIRVVTGQRPCYKAGAFARYIDLRPESGHVRARHRSPDTNGVIERYYESIKYEHLYLLEITEGPALAAYNASRSRTPARSDRLGTPDRPLHPDR